VCFLIPDFLSFSGAEELGFVSSTIGRAGKYGTPTTEAVAGSSHMTFGTDHPFFPPILDAVKQDSKWMSVVENLKAIDGVRDWSEAEKSAVRGQNALKLFGLN